MPHPGCIALWNDSISIVQEPEWAPGPIWTGAENLASTGIRSPDRPAHSESLYRVRHPDPRTAIIRYTTRLVEALVLSLCCSYSYFLYLTFY